ARPLHGPLEGVAHDAVAALAREDRLLHGELLRRAAVEPSADLGVLAFVVLTHDQHVDVGRAAAGERRFDTLEQADGPEGHILIKSAPDRNQETPQRDVVRHSGESHRAEKARRDMYTT